MEEYPFLNEIGRALGSEFSNLSHLSVTGDGDLPSIYPVTDFAAEAVAAAALSIADLIETETTEYPSVLVDRRLSSFWFWASIRPIGWNLPPTWDPIAGDYRTRDGWIKLHTNAPLHRAAVEQVLGPQTDKSTVSAAVGKWTATELESAIVEAGGCAAEMRSAEKWNIHPQGRAVASEPIIAFNENEQHRSSNWSPKATRPLEEIKVLDLTRILAGPIASRFLAGYGADVLRIDPPGWDEPNVIAEVTLGKRCTRLDLEKASDRQVFESLLAEADIFIHGYRPDALDSLGYDEGTRRAISPGLIDVSLCAYGWTGPWKKRRGFDSLMQMSTGIAHAGCVGRIPSNPYRSLYKRWIRRRVTLWQPPAYKV